jgi:hypothetical protein
MEGHESRVVRRTYRWRDGARYRDGSGAAGQYVFEKQVETALATISTKKDGAKQRSSAA